MQGSGLNYLHADPGGVASKGSRIRKNNETVMFAPLTAPRLDDLSLPLPPQKQNAPLRLA